jgi:hypothetical protein
MMCASSLPVVEKIAECPALVTDKKWCGRIAALCQGSHWFMGKALPTAV